MSNSNNELTTGTSAGEDDQIIDNISQINDNESYASSAMHSRRTERLAALFPPTQVRFEPFEKDSKVLMLLSQTLQLDASFITRLESVGYVTPARLVNRFGLSTRSIAESFVVMGPSHVLDAQMHPSTTSLVMFARYHTCKNEMNLPSSKKSWNKVKVNSKFNGYFAKWEEDSFEDLKDFLTDPSKLRDAAIVMRTVRAQIRKWTRNDGFTVASTMSKKSQENDNAASKVITQKDTSQANSKDSHDSSYHSADTPLASLRKVVHEMDSKLDAEVANVKSTVKKRVNDEVNRRIQVTIDQKAKDAVTLHLDKLLDKTSD